MGSNVCTKCAAGIPAAISWQESDMKEIIEVIVKIKEQREEFIHVR